MDGVLRSLCPAHQSLLYQILKLAHQEQLLPLFNHRQVGQTESHCCHCGVPPQDNIAPHPVRFSECKALGHGLCCPSVDSGQQTQCGGAYHSEASKSSCSIHHHSLRGCNSEGQRGSNYSCVQRCRTESYGVLCSKRLHCLSCQNQAIGRINSIVHSFASSPLLSQSSLCAPPSRLCASVCCTKNEGDSSSCYPNHICLRHIRNAVEKCTGEGDHHCPVLKREQSPSPPPLSPIPTDVEKKADEKPPSLLHHRQGEEPDPMGGSRPVSCSLMVADMFAAGENEPQCKALVSKRAHQNPSGASLQDVVTRFSQKLETITSLDKDPAPISTAIYASEKEQPQFPSTSQSPQCHADAHLTEIITTVLHTGSSSDYSLSELFNKHDNIAPKSPNTRARRRKEVMNAIATRADDAYTRRQTLQIKRDLAMLDQSCNRRKRPTAKRARLKDGAVSVTASGTPSDPDLDKAVSKREIEAGVEQLESHMAGEGTLIELTREEDEEEAKENIQAVIVPDDLRGVSEEQEREIPTERKELASTSAEAHRPGQKSTDETRDSNVKTEVVTETAVAVTPLGGLVGEDCKGVNEASDKNQAEVLPIQSSEPRMFFTTSLSEGMSNSTQDDEALTPSILHDVAKDRDAHDTPKSRSDAHLSECTKTLPFELKQEEQCEISVSSPAKSPSSPSKSASSPRSVPSSPKNCLRKSADCTPSKSLSGSEARRSPGDLPPVNETTPPKRRPGRPKKLGPRLEQKAKRPIGRPRKQIAADSAEEAKSSNSKCLTGSDVDDSVNKNLKITVLYGRSRRNKRMVSESFDQLQTDFSDALQKVDIGSDLSILLHRSKTLGTIKRASEELSFASPAMEPAPQSNGNVKFLGQEESTPSRKPGRPAKVKISGISVTVTTVSPRQRKIQLDKDTRQSSETQPHKKALLSDGKSAKDPWTISRQPTSKSTRKEEGLEARTQCKDELPHQPAPVRHSMRVRKPSIHFLHAVATSGFRSYSRSNALLRRSKQLLLTKESNERRQEQRNSAEASAEKRRPGGRARATVSQDLSKVAEASVDSVFSPNRTLRWWAPSAEEKTLNQELARRIRVISDTWVADTAEGQEKERTLNSKLDNKGNGAFARKSKHPSVVRMLFDCSPTRPRSCSMQQIRSWFMETTETQSLAIVKKASSRNPYELLHFPRSANKKSTRHSPQAERLRKHVKKFATTVPKSPLQHQQAQQQLRRRKDIRRRLFASSRAAGKRRRGALWRRRSSSGRYQATLVRARSRFLTCKERNRWQKKLKKRRKEAPRFSGGPDATGPRPGRKASTKDRFSDSFETGPTACSASQTQELVDANKEQKLCSKAWSPETLKECRVFLRKINSPDSESAEEEWESCTVTLDDGSPSAYLFAGQERELVGVVKAVKSEGKGSMSKRTASKEQTVSAVNSVQKQEAVPEERERGKYKSPMGVSAELPQPPPAKTLRQSRMRGLSGPKWCDFVLGN
ncbi:unnamed protein product [Menidia menidia]|uniref:(Atlantic silverside) hypothetical protein n=1 Tax=Menidia menidia TaxID=238744 RepID=A0A8S4B6R8_9TELE|nr:unnamed protein product [Menidia menidia]